MSTFNTNNILKGVMRDIRVLPHYNPYDDIGLNRYISVVRDYPLISAKREKELANIIQKSKDEKAVEKAKIEFAKANLKLVIKCAWRFYKGLYDPNRTKASFIDFISEGNIALMRAIDLFKAEYKCKFSTYAVPAITHQIARAFMQFRLIRVPLKHFKYFGLMGDIKEFYNDNITDEALMKKTKVSKTIFDMLAEENKYKNDELVSLALFEEEVIAGKNEKVIEVVAGHELKEYLISKINTLPPHLRDTLLAKFFDEKEPTVREIAKVFGITRQAAFQRIHRGLKDLRKRIVEEEAFWQFDMIDRKKKGKKNEHSKKHSEKV